MYEVDNKVGYVNSCSDDYMSPFSFLLFVQQELRCNYNACLTAGALILILFIEKAILVRKFSLLNSIIHYLRFCRNEIHFNSDPHSTQCD